jgi:hypothetical protein
VTSDAHEASIRAAEAFTGAIMAVVRGMTDPSRNVQPLPSTA